MLPRRRRKLAAVVASAMLNNSKADHVLRNHNQRSLGYNPDGTAATPYWRDFYFHRNPLLQLVYVTNHADPPTSRLKLLQNRDCHPEAVCIQRAEAFVDKQAFNLDAPVRRHTREAEGESEAYEKPLSAREVVNAADFIGHISVYNLQYEFATWGTLQFVTRL